MSLVTYTAVIAVRYPELDNVQNDLVCFDNYLLGEQATSGGFLPLFWDAPSAYMHAATDIGSAVDWLQSQVDLSSDENGFLSGGRSRRMKELPEKEVLAQLEEAYAHATVALTQAQKLCTVSSWAPSTCEGCLVPQLAVSNMVQACVECMSATSSSGPSLREPSFRKTSAAEVFLKDGSLNDGPDDEAFLLSLEDSTRGVSTGRLG